MRRRVHPYAVDSQGQSKNLRACRVGLHPRSRSRPKGLCQGSMVGSKGVLVMWFLSCWLYVNIGHSSWRPQPIFFRMSSTVLLCASGKAETRNALSQLPLQLGPRHVTWCPPIRCNLRAWIWELSPTQFGEGGGGRKCPAARGSSSGVWAQGSHLVHTQSGQQWCLFTAALPCHSCQAWLHALIETLRSSLSLFCLSSPDWVQSFATKNPEWFATFSLSGLWLKTERDNVAWDEVRALFTQALHFPKPWVILGVIPAMRCEAPGCWGGISKRGAEWGSHCVLLKSPKRALSCLPWQLTPCFLPWKS